MGHVSFMTKLALFIPSIMFLKDFKPMNNCQFLVAWAHNQFSVVQRTYTM